MRLRFAAVLLVLAVSSPAWGGVPLTITYQGVLSDNSGLVMGTHNLVFKIYDAATGGTLLWSETHNGVAFSNGSFSVVLGVTSSVSLPFDAQYWLGIAIDGGSELSPRTVLTSVPYSLTARTALSCPSCSFGLPFTGSTNTAGSAFSISNSGTGMAAIFDLHNTSATNPAVQITTNGSGDGVSASVTNGNGLSGVSTNASKAGVYGSDGNGTGVQGISFGGTGVRGEATSTSASGFGVFGLHDGSGQGVKGQSNTGVGVYGVSNTGPYGVKGLVATSNAANAAGVYGAVVGTGINGFGVYGTHDGTGPGVFGTSTGGNGVWGNSTTSTGVYGSSNGAGDGVSGFSNDGNGVRGSSGNGTGVVGVATSSSGFGGLFQNTAGGYALKADGRAQVRVLEILGSDMAEQFDVEGPVRDGLVMVIDKTHPGHLRPSDMAYDEKVAGVLSGAGGIRTGIAMGQPGTAANGAYSVSLSGRVYCWCDASYGSIEPGDLLTTSTTVGHAMVVRDKSRAEGAILGKALTGLKEGRGLVLVLLTLR